MSHAEVIVFDSNLDALRWRAGRVAALTGVEPAATASSVATALLAEALPEGGVVLVDLLATDRLALDRPGERLIRRLRNDPRTAHVRPVAWSAHRSPDVVESVRRSGALGFVPAGGDADAETAALEFALGGEEPWPQEAGGGAAAQAKWFEDEFGVAWEPWVEPALARLVSGRDRKALAQELIEIGAADSVSHAASRMRKLARLVAGEHRNSPSAVAAAAATVLTQLAAHRPLGERPAPALSLERGARIVRTQPSLVRAAGLTGRAAADVAEMDRLIESWRKTRTARRGAPSADEVREERRWAAGRLAVQQAAAVHNVDEIIDGLLARLLEVLAALDDARQDDLYHPEARAAAALLLIQEGRAPAVGGADLAAGAARWRSHTPLELAVATGEDLDVLRAFVAAVDEAAAGPQP